jgi:hypothetical protein
VRNDLVVAKLRACFHDYAQVVLQRYHLGLRHDEASLLESRLSNVRAEQPFGDDFCPDLEWLPAPRSVGNVEAAVEGI